MPEGVEQHRGSPLTKDLSVMSSQVETKAKNITEEEFKSWGICLEPELPLSSHIVRLRTPLLVKPL